MPKFLSHEDLLSTDLDSHVDRMIASLSEKDTFIMDFKANFALNPNVDSLLYNTHSFSPYLESHFIQPVKPFSLEEIEGYRIAAVDGGLGFRQYLGLQITLIKAAVVQYHFMPDSSPKITTFPPLRNKGNYCLYTDYAPATEFHGGLLAGYRRQIAENAILIDFIQSSSLPPEIVILDGSVLPPPCPVSAREDELTFKYYSHCFESYNELYEICNAKGILLIGCIKDTRSTVLRDLLLKSLPFFLSKYPFLQGLTKTDFRKILQSFTDVELFSRLLTPNTRSLAFRYDFQDYVKYQSSFSSNFFAESKAAVENGVENSDTDGISRLFTLLKPKDGIFASYLQISPFDSPIRVEFVSPLDPDHVKRRIDTIAKVIFPISRITPQCTLPIPQIEAHMLAHLPEVEIDLVVNQLQRRLCLKQFCSSTANSLLKGEQEHSTAEFSQLEHNNPLIDHFNLFSEKRHTRLPF